MDDKTVQWKKRAASRGLGMGFDGKGVLDWLAVGKGRFRDVLVSQPGLQFESDNGRVEVEYLADTNTQDGWYPVRLTGMKSGSGSVRAMRKGKAVGTLRANVLVRRNVTLTLKNVVAASGKHRATQASAASQLASRLDKIFVHQGNFNFQVSRKADAAIPNDQFVHMFGVDGIDGSNFVQISTVFRKHFDRASTFNVFFCTWLHKAPCAIGVSTGPYILVNESYTARTPAKGQSAAKANEEYLDFLAHVLAHEVVHSMGLSHHPDRNNLMYATSDGGLHLDWKQTAFISNPSNWDQFEK